MAEEKSKKKPVERKIISASTGEEVTPKTKAAASKAEPEKVKAAATKAEPAEKPKPAPKAEADKPKPAAAKAEAVEEKAAEEKAEAKPARRPVTTDEEKAKAKKLRLFAVLCWVVAIAFEVVAILFLKYNAAAALAQPLIVWFVGAVVLDLIAVVAGSRLWINANHIDPVSEKNKVKFFLWNNMGVIVSMLAFVPLIILTLRDKNLDKKNKNIATIAAIVALLIAVPSSIDYHPVSVEDKEDAQTLAEAVTGDADGDVFWTPFGHKYHLYSDCQALTNSATILTGSVSEAIAAKRVDLCKFCAKTAEDSGIDLPVKETADLPPDTSQEEPQEEPEAA